MAKYLFETVQSSVDRAMPWTITPSVAPDVLPDLAKSFESEFAAQRISLTDTFIIEEALRLKTKHKKTIKKTYIWTKDTALKSREPDREPESFPEIQ